MIEIPSSIEGKSFHLYKLESTLKPMGYVIGGNWEYDHGYFDYKINDEQSYQYLRVPFTAIDGQLDSQNCTVKLGRPFLLSHEYQNGIDEAVRTAGTLNQFQEPQNPDAEFPNKYIDLGKSLVKELEDLLGQSNDE